MQFKYQPEALSVAEPNRQPAGGGRQRWILQCLWLFPDLPLNSVLVEASLNAQLGSSSTHLEPEEAAISVDCFVVSNRLPRATSRQHLILTCTRVPPKRPQNQQKTGQHQTTSEHNPISFTSSISKERSQQAPDLPRQIPLRAQALHSSSYIVVRVGPHSQPA